MRFNDSRLPAAVVLLAATVALASCTPSPDPTPSPTPPPTSAAPTGTPSPDAPSLKEDGSADDNLPLFALVMNEVWDAADDVRGRDYIDALAAAGFDKSAMEVTADETSVGNAADAIQFSVRWDDECLVGQVGPSTEVPTAVVLPLLPEGDCLIGKTRSIDW